MWYDSLRLVSLPADLQVLRNLAIAYTGHRKPSSRPTQGYVQPAHREDTSWPRQQGAFPSLFKKCVPQVDLSCGCQLSGQFDILIWFCYELAVLYLFIPKMFIPKIFLDLNHFQIIPGGGF